MLCLSVNKGIAGEHDPVEGSDGPRESGREMTDMEEGSEGLRLLGVERGFNPADIGAFCRCRDFRNSSFHVELRSDPTDKLGFLVSDTRFWSRGKKKYGKDAEDPKVCYICTRRTAQDSWYTVFPELSII